MAQWFTSLGRHNLLQYVLSHYSTPELRKGSGDSGHISHLVRRWSARLKTPPLVEILSPSVNMCVKSPGFSFFAAASVFVHRKLAESADTERAIYQSLCVLWETARWLVCRGNTSTVVILVFTEEQIGPSGETNSVRALVLKPTPTYLWDVCAHRNIHNMDLWWANGPKIPADVTNDCLKPLHLHTESNMTVL